MSMNFFRMLESHQQAQSYLSQHPSVVDMTISKSASGYTNHYLPRTNAPEAQKPLESPHVTTPKTPTDAAVPTFPRDARLDSRVESRLDEAKAFDKAMSENRNLDNIIPPRPSDRELDRTLERGGLDSPSLQWARNMLQAHQQLSDIKSSANHSAHGHNMTTPLQNGANSNGPPTMVPTNRLQVDLSCTPSINSFSPPTSLSNNGQLVVPHPLKPIKTRKSYQCKMCDQMFENKSELMLHTQQIHKQDPKPYKCPTCNKSFANSSYLSQHNRIHAGIKPYQCNFCSRKFTQLSHLQQHRRTHTGEKPYKCQHPGCGKAFTQLSNLQTHSRSHMTDKPFRCNSCYKCYADEISLREHIPKHSDTKHLKTHICRLCGKSYTQETYLARHMAKHSLDGGNSRLRLPKDSMMNFQNLQMNSLNGPLNSLNGPLNSLNGSLNSVMNRPMKPEPGIENCCSPRSPTGLSGQKSAFIPMNHHYGPQIPRSQPTQFPFPPQLQSSPLTQSLSSSLPHISCVTSPGYFPPYDPMAGHRNDSLDRELQSRDNSSMIARSLLSLQHIKSFSTTFAQSNNNQNHV